MKIRTGFVSNSSSSSYVIIIPSSDFENCISQLSELGKKVIREIVESKRILGVDAKLLTYISGEDSNFGSDCISKELQAELKLNDNEDQFWESIDHFAGAVREHPNGFYDRQSF